MISAGGIGIEHYLTVGAILFVLGVLGIFLNRKIFAMLVLTVAAAEAAIGLAILVIYFRGHGSIAVDDINQMKG